MRTATKVLLTVTSAGAILASPSLLFRNGEFRLEKVLVAGSAGGSLLVGLALAVYFHFNDRASMGDLRARRVVDLMALPMAVFSSFFVLTVPVILILSGIFALVVSTGRAALALWTSGIVAMPRIKSKGKPLPLRLLHRCRWIFGPINREHIECIVEDLTIDVVAMRRDGIGRIGVYVIVSWRIGRSMLPITIDACSRALSTVLQVARLRK